MAINFSPKVGEILECNLVTILLAKMDRSARRITMADSS